MTTQPQPAGAGQLTVAELTAGIDLTAALDAPLRHFREALLASAQAADAALSDRIRVALESFARNVVVPQTNALSQSLGRSLAMFAEQHQESLRRIAEAAVPVPDLSPISEHLARINVSLLDGLFHDVEPWQGLPAPARSAVADVLDDARTAADAGEAQNIPEEVIAEFQEQAAEFAAGVRGPLPPAAQKFLFALSMATLALSLPIYVSVISDTGNKVLDEVTQFWPLAVTVFTAAYMGWDRMQERRSRQETDQDGQAE